MSSSTYLPYILGFWNSESAWVETSPRHHPTKFDFIECVPPQKSSWNASSADSNCDPPPPYPVQRETERQSKTTTTTTLPSALSLWGRNLTSSGSSWNPSKQWGSQETHWRLSHPPCWGISTTNCSSRKLHATKDELGPSHGHGYGCTHNPPAPVIKIATNFLAPSNYSQKRINNDVTIGYWMPNAKPYDENGQLRKRRNAPCNLSHTHAYPPAPVLKIAANQLPYSLKFTHKKNHRWCDHRQLDAQCRTLRWNGPT